MGGLSRGGGGKGYVAPSPKLLGGCPLPPSSYAYEKENRYERMRPLRFSTVNNSMFGIFHTASIESRMICFETSTTLASGCLIRMYTQQTIKSVVVKFFGLRNRKIKIHRWLGHLWNHELMFDAGVVRADEC